MLNFKIYLQLLIVRVVLAIICGATATWLVQNDPRHYTRAYNRQVWSTLKFLTFVGWSTLIITGTQIILYVSNVWSLFITDTNAGGYFIAHTIYTCIYTIFWLAIAASLTDSLPTNCRLISQCPPTRAATVFSWFTLIVIGIETFFLLKEVFFGTISAVDPILPTTNTKKKAPKKKAAAAAPTPAATKGNPTAVAVPPLPHTDSRLIERLCIQCSTVDSAPGSVFCGADCVLQARARAPALMALPHGHYMFRTIADLFTQTWQHPTSRPTIQYIYVIVSTEEYDRMYRAYRAGVESVGNFLSQGLNEGNEQFRWHGTTRECRVGDPGNPSLCTSTSCSMCSIIRYSFDIERFGPRWGRFGKGIYTSAVSSKSNDYQKTLQATDWSSLLLNNVVIGNGYHIQSNSDTLLQPPSEYDSISGLPGQALNYEETVVYRNDAIRPAYLVIYLTPQ
ncbi:hypothetical protein FRC19_005218 [Serendipita sp. 401]|nr:hypothetical protein FRC19_005218 [Serendipita sp. 401]